MCQPTGVWVGNGNQGSLNFNDFYLWKPDQICCKGKKLQDRIIFLSIINADSCKSWSQVGGGGEIWKKQQKEAEDLRNLRKSQKGSAGERKTGA